VIFFLVFVGSTIFYLTSFNSSFEKPEFNANLFEENKSSDNKNHDFSKVDERRRIQDKFDKEIKKVISLGGFSNEAYDLLFEILVEYPEEYRGAYINGLYDYLEDGKKYAEKNKSKFDGFELFNSYSSMFYAETERVKFENESTKMNKLIVIGVIAVSMLLYIVFLLIPILIKIEENTRKKSTEINQNVEFNNDLAKIKEDKKRDKSSYNNKKNTVSVA
jgi:hypothetical protein